MRGVDDARKELDLPKTGRKSDLVAQVFAYCWDVQYRMSPWYRAPTDEMQRQFAVKMAIAAWNNPELFEAAFPAWGNPLDPARMAAFETVKQCFMNAIVAEVESSKPQTGPEPLPWLAATAKEGDAPRSATAVGDEDGERTTPVKQVPPTHRDYDDPNDDEGALVGTLLNQGASLERMAMELENLRLRKAGAGAAGGIAGSQAPPISMVSWRKAVLIKTLADEGRSLEEIKFALGWFQAHPDGDTQGRKEPSGLNLIVLNAEEAKLVELMRAPDVMALPGAGIWNIQLALDKLRALRLRQAGTAVSEISDFNAPVPSRPGRIDESFNKLTDQERRAAQWWADRGYDIIAVPPTDQRGDRPNILLVKNEIIIRTMELKHLDPPPNGIPNLKTISSQAEKGAKQGPHVTIDARGSGHTEEDARKAWEILKGAYYFPAGTTAVVIGKGYTFKLSRGERQSGPAPRPAETRSLRLSDLGEELGEGESKRVYAYGENQVVAVLKEGEEPGTIAREISNLERLRDEIRLPVVNARIITVDGQLAILMDRFAEGSKDIIRGFDQRTMRYFGHSKYLNANSIRDLEEIWRIMKEKNVAIDDLQFLIGKDGHVVITDPEDVHIGKTSDFNQFLIEDLIRIARRNIRRNIRLYAE
jgi:hypothetical protein